MEHEISKGAIVERSKLHSIDLPQGIVDTVEEGITRFLLIFSSRSNTIKVSIIPCKEKEVAKMIVWLDSFSPNTVKQIAEIVSNMNIHPLHTTGICFHEEDCCYEAYIEIGDGVVPEGIRRSFLNIEGCKSVEIEILAL